MISWSEVGRGVERSVPWGYSTQSGCRIGDGPQTPRAHCPVALKLPLFMISSLWRALVKRE